MAGAALDAKPMLAQALGGRGKLPQDPGQRAPAPGFGSGRGTQRSAPVTMPDRWHPQGRRIGARSPVPRAMRTLAARPATGAEEWQSENASRGALAPGRDMQGGRAHTLRAGDRCRAAGSASPAAPGDLARRQCRHRRREDHVLASSPNLEFGTQCASPP